MLLEGQQISRYHLVRLLGSGGMGDVYMAEDPRIGQQVAIKILRTEAISSSDAQSTGESTRLFEREARAIVKLDHPHILPLFDYGEQRLGEATLLYLVMPYRPEGSLAKWVNQRKKTAPLVPRQITYLIQQAADALQHAHNRQIIHQDVKPSNFLMREREGDPSYPDLLLSDFGIARMASMTSSISQSVRGTPTYMAPEQYSGRSLPASDQYALAIMTYELLTGAPPFQGGAVQIMYHHLNDRPQPPSTSNAKLSPELDAVLLRALEKQPEVRYPSITAFASALQHAVQHLPEVTHSTATAPQSNTLSPAPSIHSHEVLHAQLAISQEEARKGTTRTITLPGGKLVHVYVPAGVENGYKIQLEQQDSPAPDRSTINAIILTILIKQEAVGGSIPNPVSEDRTYLTPPAEKQDIANDNIKVDMPINAQSPDAAPVEKPVNGSNAAAGYANPPIAYDPYQNAYSDEHHYPAQIPSTMPVAPPPPPQGTPPLLPMAGSEGQRAATSGKRFRFKSVYLIGVALLLIIVSIIGVNAFSGYQATQAKVHAMATAQRNRQLQQSNATGTASAQANLSANATGTAVAQVTATAQAQVQATAAVVSANPYPAYFPGHGTLALYDPLKQPYYWINQTDNSGGGGCQFINGTYHIHESHTLLLPCYALTPSSSEIVFTNFAFEVQMTITQGDCGGMLLRDDGRNAKDYYFVVCQDRTYSFGKYTDNTHASLLPTPSADNSSINGGLNQANRIGVVAQGSTFQLFINNQQVASIQDGSYSKGGISLLAEKLNNTTDVAYTNAKVWTL